MHTHLFCVFVSSEAIICHFTSSFEPENTKALSRFPDFYYFSRVKPKRPQQYYPFGSLQSKRNYNAGDYRFGFNGKENDNEVKGTGNSVNFGVRIYDSRLGRWMATDRRKLTSTCWKL